MSTPTPTPTPAEGLAIILRWLCLAVAARCGGAGLSPPLIGLIIGRIREINQCVSRLAALVRDGRYLPRRRSAPPRAPIGRRPRRANPLPRNFGWLLPLVPEAVGYRSQLEFLLRDPEMVALLAAAPASLARPLRSLCWMLRVSPPPILAPILAPIPAPVLPPQAPAPAKTSPAPPPAARAAPPSPPAQPPAPPPSACACGPPLPA